MAGLEKKSIRPAQDIPDYGPPRFLALRGLSENPVIKNFVKGSVLLL